MDFSASPNTVFLVLVITVCVSGTFANVISSESGDHSATAIQDESASGNDSEEAIMAFGGTLNQQQQLKPRSRIYFPGKLRIKGHEIVSWTHFYLFSLRLTRPLTPKLIH